ncbi:hypothetical protein [Mycobacterium servetii]|uniref:Antitoxin n=1 Tax=Mycobacterium servetii TaxID=3237418 RepID=A0ABV4C068_9MYCO
MTAAIYGTRAMRDLVREAIEFWIDDEALRLTRLAEESEREVLHRIAGRGWCVE